MSRETNIPVLTRKPRDPRDMSADIAIIDAEDRAEAGSEAATEKGDENSPKGKGKEPEGWQSYDKVKGKEEIVIEAGDAKDRLDPEGSGVEKLIISKPLLVRPISQPALYYVVSRKLI